ncbi:probable cyclin-dependent serine/threonine-protein kinase DDB_G0292550 isoform X2 [Adelges cooleyi]|uniref:probable cyclin-dependent serine/threonine-protein kinase DDB_G0292550 isoform X2 n=1 Tax=Adelges cooleyi TaxID=133065 RepID=UPI0021802AC2|nr:probable cyclin-dependent serine/threonine-protein kinase DDB_G0292550 isoform X2 [Adelges cooleyi]
MINIKIILLLGLAAYVACDSGRKKGTTNKYWYNDDSDSSESSEDSDYEVYRPKQYGKAKSKIPAKLPKQKPTVANVQGYGTGGNFSNFGNFGNFGNQGVSSNSTTVGNLIGNPNINIERTTDGFKINGRIVPGVNPYNKIEIDWKPEGGITVNGEDKPGFEDIKYSGRTILASISNPAYNYGSGPSQAADKKYQKKTKYTVKHGNNIGLNNSYNTNSNNVNWNNVNSNNVNRNNGRGQKYPNRSWQYNNGNHNDVQFNNSGNRGQQFNNQGNVGVQYKNHGYIGHATFNQDEVTVELIGDAIKINGIKIPRVKAKNLKQITWGGGSLKINGIKNEKFNGIEGAGIMNF